MAASQRLAMSEENEIEAAENELVEEFSFLGDWMERYQYLIELGRTLPPLDEHERADEHKLAGCQSQVWFVAETRDQRLYFRAASDAAIVSGLIAVLLRIYQGRRPADILASTPDFVRRLGLDQHLSPTRSNGLAAMLAKIHASARGALDS